MGAPALPRQHAHRPLLLGFSGGLDSSVLLHLLAGAPALRDNGLRAIHVHHGLHVDADAWAAHCADVCAALGIALCVAHVAVVDDGEGAEGAARRARHAAFAAELRKGEVLTLAQHRDDQAETFLLRALRGSGPDGLAAMRPWRSHAQGWLWRPLLDVPRSRLDAHAQRHALRWVEDPGNRELAFDRNFLRHRLLPLLRERWPSADASFARSAALQAEAADLLADEDARALASVRTLDPGVLCVPPLLRLKSARRARVLRRWVHALGLPPLPAQGVARIEADLLAANVDTQATFAWAGAAIRRWRDLLHADVQRAAPPGDWQVEWDGAAPLELPTGDFLAFEFSTDTFVGADSAASFLPDHPSPPQRSRLKPLPRGNAAGSPFHVHARRGGERIALPGREHSHALKHVLQELGVAPWERERLPLLSDEHGELLAAGDLALSASFDDWLRENRVRWVWKRLNK